MRGGKGDCFAPISSGLAMTRRESLRGISATSLLSLRGAREASDEAIP